MKNPPMSSPPRRSACAAQSRAAELARLRQLSVQERIKTALTIGTRFTWLKPMPADIVELLVRNPETNLDEMRAVCARYGMDGLEELIAESRNVSRLAGD
jgi:hypothetical protein